MRRLWALRYFRAATTALLLAKDIPMTRRWVTTREAAEYLGLTLKALEKRIERRQIPFTKLGWSRRFDIQVLDRMLERGSNERAVLRQPLGQSRAA